MEASHIISSSLHQRVNLKASTWKKYEHQLNMLPELIKLSLEHLAVCFLIAGSSILSSTLKNCTVVIAVAAFVALPLRKSHLQESAIQVSLRLLPIGVVQKVTILKDDLQQCVAPLVLISTAGSLCELLVVEFPASIAHGTMPVCIALTVVDGWWGERLGLNTYHLQFQVYTEGSLLQQDQHSPAV